MSKYATKPVRWTIMHPDKGGPLEVVSAEVYDKDRNAHSALVAALELARAIIFDGFVGAGAKAKMPVYENATEADQYEQICNALKLARGEP